MKQRQFVSFIDYFTKMPHGDVAIDIAFCILVRDYGGVELLLVRTGTQFLQRAVASVHPPATAVIGGCSEPHLLPDGQRVEAVLRMLTILVEGAVVQIKHFQKDCKIHALPLLVFEAADADAACGFIVLRVEIQVVLPRKPAAHPSFFQRLRKRWLHLEASDAEVAAAGAFCHVK